MAVIQGKEKHLDKWNMETPKLAGDTKGRHYFRIVGKLIPCQVRKQWGGINIRVCSSIFSSSDKI